MPVSRQPQLDPLDIKLLRLFLKVVECGGFSSAQADLNVSASSISTQMAQLESRLGMRLCERGRGGFRLTDKGQHVYRAAYQLEDAMAGFRTQLGDLRGKLIGKLSIGIPDSVISHPDLSIDHAIALFNRRDHAVHLTLHVHQPDEMERLLISDKLNLGISAFYHHVPGLVYEHLADEEHALYLGYRHPLFKVAPEKITRQDVYDADYVARGYLPNRSTGPAAGLKKSGTAYDMEAILTMILSGAYIGHLPRHYAEAWVASKEIREIKCDEFSFASRFEVAYRRGQESIRLVQTFLEDLHAAHGAA